MTAEPFAISVPDEVLDDVRDRLRHTRYPLDVGNEDWRYGVERSYLEELVDHWITSYDWRAHERAMNAVAQFRTTVDGLPIHYVHERGTGPDPMPLILSHGWPWTFWDFHKVIGPLTDPGAHGGDPADAFDVVIPSLPGFGFSSPLTEAGVEWMRTADVWAALMTGLGYDRFAAHGGDWGGLITAQLGHKYADRIIGAHLGVCTPMTLFETGLPTEDRYADDEKHRFHHTQQRMQSVATSHLVVQSDDPQTLAYGLHDSPAGLCSWILERRRSWSDSNGDVESRFSKDDLITTAMLYWITDTMVTSMRYYWEAQHNLWKPSHDRSPVVEAPTAITLWPQELMLMPTELMRSFYNLQRLTEMPRGGHFHPMEEPELLVEDIRAFFRTLR
jgi:pimeloyl-ACP methyl ester carboxylesterase